MYKKNMHSLILLCTCTIFPLSKQESRTVTYKHAKNFKQCKQTICDCDAFLNNLPLLFWVLAAH